MNVVSLELSKELYELSGWKDTDFKVSAFTERVSPMAPPFYGSEIPAYDLGYLLQRLPRMNEEYWLTIQPVVYPQWCASYDRNDGISTKFESFADVPEDAAAKLAIELFKQGILTKDGDRE